LIDQLEKGKQQRQSDTRLYEKWLKEKSLPKETRRRLEQTVRVNRILIKRFEEHLKLLEQEEKNRTRDFLETVDPLDRVPPDDAFPDNDPC